MSLRQEIDYSGAHVSHIKKTLFRIASPERILENSVTEIYNHLATPYDKQDGHLFDRKMGARDRTKENLLSKLPMKWDPGHFGHIRLAKPVFQMPYYTMIVQILNMVCHRCSVLLVSPKNDAVIKQIRARKGKARFAFVQQLLKRENKKNCWNCGACTIKCVKDTKDGSPKIAIKKGGVRSRSERNDATQTILVNPEVCQKQAAKQQGRVGAQGDDDTAEGETTDETAAAATAPTKELFDFIDAEVAHTILKKITDNDCEMMGLSPESARPDWMIWTVMPVPPPSMRPAVTNESGQTADDDLTHKLNDIVKTNNQIRNILASLGTDKERKELYNWWQLLQYHVATYIDNDVRSNIPPAINRSGRAYKTLRQRINHKEGRIRGNLMGKRADKTARSVITPDPNISIDELGVPYDIAMTLTRDEIVNEYNIKRLTQLVRNGPNWPGASGIDPRGRSRFEAGCETDAGSRRGAYRISLQHMSEERRLKCQLHIGDIVQRHLLDGDVVLFNRQPSLHKMSMMGHRAKILPGKTFRLNPQVCTPYNADFDGDEMNMHVANSYQTETEIREIALVPTQIVSPQASRPIMGLIQDALLASYRFTKIRSEPHLNTLQLMTLLGVTSGYAGRLPLPSQDNGSNKLLWDSKAVVSTFLPKVNYRYDRSDGKEKVRPVDPKVASEVLEIENGLMKSGYFDKDTFGSKANSMIHVTWNDWGTEPTRNLFDDMNKMAMQWLIMDGFSVGMSDMSIAKPEYDEIRQQIHEKVIEAQTKIEFLHQGRYPIVEPKDKIDFHKILVRKLGYWVDYDTIYFSDTGKPIMEQFEADMYVVLNNARKAAEESTSKKILPTNRMASMINSGSKGTKTNTVQIMVLLGQQDMDGGRIPNGYQRRPLPHFNKDTLVPEAHGFIDSGYLLGLGPPQYFFHAMSGRVGVISTSIKTAETGYLQRRLMKALEDLGVRYDWTVRNANDLVFQFYYGMDGFDGSKLEVQKLDYVPLTDNEFRMRYQFQPNELADLSQLFTPDVAESISETPETRQELDAALNQEFQQLSLDRDLLRRRFFRDPSKLPDKFYVPVNFTRLIESYRSRFYIRNRKLSSLDPRYSVPEVERLIALIVGEYQIPGTYPPGTPQRGAGIRSPQDLLILKAMIRSYLASKKLVKLGFTKEAFDCLIQDINRKFEEAYVTPGEMVGAIAAQSIGEPSTQMTLNSVDYATPMAIVWLSTIKPPPAPIDGPVGALIDALMLERASDVQLQPDGVTEYLPLGKGEAIALSCDSEGKARWTALEAVTRHPVVNKDGSSTLVRVNLQSGRTVDVTKGKSMLVARNGSIEACDGSDLQVGDCVPVVGKVRMGDERLTSLDLRTILVPPYEFSEIPLTQSFGRFVGAYLLHGHIADDKLYIANQRKDNSRIPILLNWAKSFDISVQVTKNEVIFSSTFLCKVLNAICGNQLNKRVPSFALIAPDDFNQGLLSNYMFHGMTALGSKELCNGLATLLQIHCGIPTSIKSDDYFHFNVSEDTPRSLEDQFLDKVIALEPVEPTSSHKKVYDLTVAETRNMTTMSGIGLADTFHLAGVGEKANVSRGVPRIKEILRVTNALATPTVTVSIKREALLRPRNSELLPDATWLTIKDKDLLKENPDETTYDRERKIREEDEKKIAHMNAEDLASQIEYTRLRDLISSITILYDPDPDRDQAIQVAQAPQIGQEFLVSYMKFINELGADANEKVDPQRYPWVIRVEFKKNILNRKNITIADIQLALSELQKAASPTGYKGDQSLLFPAMDDNAAFIDADGDPAYVMRITVRNDIANQSPINLIRYLEKVLLDIRVKGIPGIETARVRFIKDYPYYDPIDGGIKKTFNYEIDTNGVNMLDIWNMRDVDPERTYSNHIIEIYETLGISAVREAIVNELNEVFLYAGASINPRHVELLADMMTSRGYLISVDRHGMSKGDSGPWARASFEETTAQIFRAAQFSEVDSMTGVSANIMTGQFIPAGTNSFRVGLDETILESAKSYRPPALTELAVSALAAAIGEDAVPATCAKETTVAAFCSQEPAKAFMYDFL
jgi:DNA-directed RNA polymerase beta' subunit